MGVEWILVSWIGWDVGVLGALGCLGSEVRKPSLVHLKRSRTDRIS